MIEKNCRGPHHQTYRQYKNRVSAVGLVREKGWKVGTRIDSEMWKESGPMLIMFIDLDSVTIRPVVSKACSRRDVKTLPADTHEVGGE